IDWWVGWTSDSTDHCSSYILGFKARMSRTFRHIFHCACSVEHAFGVYTDSARWRRRSIFGDLRWVQGEPWKVGSRMEVELTYPQPTVVQEVVTGCKPPSHAGLISHALGVTIHHNVYFEPDGDGCRVTVVIDIAGPVSFVAGFAVRPMIESITIKQFED